MTGVSIGVGTVSATAAFAAETNAARPGPSTAMTSPGLVQN